MGQSSNDVFPSAVHLAALDVAQNELLPALKQLERSFARKAQSFQNVVKSGRTHLMDAVPVTLGQEFAGYAAQIALGQERVAVRARARRADPARRHRDRDRPEHASRGSPSGCARGCAANRAEADRARRWTRSRRRPTATRSSSCRGR